MSTKRELESDIAVDEELKKPSKYNVLVHNNDITTFQEVMIILMQAFSMSESDATKITNDVHHKQKGVCGTYSREIAEHKLIVVEAVKDQLITVFPIRAREITALKFTVEEA